VIFFVLVVFLAVVASVVCLLVACAAVALPGHGRWSGWRRVVVSVTFGCAALAVASYGWGALSLMATVSVARDGGAQSAPLPPHHPCTEQLDGVVDYTVDFAALRTVCVLHDGERREVDDVPQAVRATAAASAASLVVLGGVLVAGNHRPWRLRTA
jgi:hypothetical protein